MGTAASAVQPSEARQRPQRSMPQGEQKANNFSSNNPAGLRCTILFAYFAKRVGNGLTAISSSMAVVMATFSEAMPASTFYCSYEESA
jgi:hypothetical protein